MITRKLLIAVLIVTLCACNSKKENPIHQTQWLIGTWQHQDESGNVSYESWKKINSDELSGKSYVLQEGDTVVFEELSLVCRQDSLFYIPTVKGHNNDRPISFPLSSISEDKMLFENLLHDFPQQISYQKIGTDSLVAEVSGLENGVQRKFAIPMKRVE